MLNLPASGKWACWFICLRDTCLIASSIFIAKFHSVISKKSSISFQKLYKLNIVAKEYFFEITFQT